MKSKISVLALAVVASVSMVLVSCGDDDLTNPVVSVTGDDPQIIALGDDYTELGATATDEQDGDLSDAIVIDATSVNTDVVGKYTVSYSVVDEAGNTGSAERDVWVMATNDSYAGTYDVTESYTNNETGESDVITYVVSITAAAADETKILIENLGDYDPAVTVEAFLEGDLQDDLTINQTVGGITFVGTGSITTGTTTTFNFELNYTQDGTDSYTSEATFVKQ